MYFNCCKMNCLLRTLTFSESESEYGTNMEDYSRRLWTLPSRSFWPLLLHFFIQTWRIFQWVWVFPFFQVYTRHTLTHSPPPPQVLVPLPWWQCPRAGHRSGPPSATPLPHRSGGTPVSPRSSPWRTGTRWPGGSQTLGCRSPRMTGEGLGTETRLCWRQNVTTQNGLWKLEYVLVLSLPENLVVPQFQPFTHNSFSDSSTL